MSSQSKRIVHYSFGDPAEVLRVEDGHADQALRPGEARVRVNRSIIHPGDLQLVEARYADPSQPLPDGRVPGLEAAGTIVEAHDDALTGTDLRIGSRVAFFAPGAWQTFATVPAAALVPLPDELPDIVGTQVLINTIIARHVLRKAINGLDQAPGPILQTGASSAVGRIISVPARREGIETIRLVRSAESAGTLAERIPGGTVIATESDGWKLQVREIAGNELSTVLDGVGGPLTYDLSDLLARRGRLISYGVLSNAPSDLKLFVPKDLSLAGVSLGTWRDDTSVADLAQDFQTALDLGLTEPELFSGAQEFQLSELGVAIEAVTAPGKTGNIILDF